MSWTGRTIPTTTFESRTDRDFLAQENGFNILQENGYEIVTEESYNLINEYGTRTIPTTNWTTTRS